MVSMNWCDCALQCSVVQCRSGRLCVCLRMQVHLSCIYDASPSVNDLVHHSHDCSFFVLRVPVLEVSPYGNAYLRLWFNSTAAMGGDVGEVFLFLNDETGQSEESFLFTVRAKR